MKQIDRTKIQRNTRFDKPRKSKRKKVFITLLIAVFCTFLFVGFFSGFVVLRHKQLCSYDQTMKAGLISSDSQSNFCPNILDGSSLGEVVKNALNIGLIASFKVGASEVSQADGSGEGTACNSDTDIICWLKQMGGELKQTNGFTTMLLAVSDNRSHTGSLAGNTDSIMVITLDNKSGKVLLISFPRDIYTTYKNTWGSTVSTKINSVYAYYGREKFVEVISMLIGKPIHYSAILSFDIFDQLITQMGGVDIYLDEPFKDLFPCSEVPANSGYKCNGAFGWFTFPAGQNHFNSFEAQVYSRSRYASNDYDRAKRQQDIVKAVISNAINNDKPLGEKLGLYKSFYDTFISKVETDVELKDLAAMLTLFDKLNENAASIVVDPFLDNGKIVYEYGISEVGWVTKFNDYSYKQLNKYIASIWNNLTFYTETPKILVVNASGGEIPSEVQEIAGNSSVTASIVSKPSDLKGIRVYDLSKGEKKSSLNEILALVPSALLYSSTIDEINQSEFGEDIVIIVGN